MDPTPAVPVSRSGPAWDEFLLLVSLREETRMAVQSVADSLGCTAFECANVAQALEYLRQAQFLLVVCEEHLPDGD
jgi:hypothetical protein